jgi:predicted aminopeptidase
LKTKIVLFFLSLAIAFLGLKDYDLINYGVSQLNGQLKILGSTLTKKEFIKLSSTSHKEKLALKKLESILRFAKLNGLDAGNKYQKIVSPSHPKLMVVSASQQFSVKPYTWSFPFLGSVPYKGFFNRNLLYKEMNFLRKRNFDCDTGQVNAYSTLGILNDPIMPSMLHSSESEMAETIFHELVHKYYFEPKKQHLNESLAQAFGEELTLLYLQKFYGKRSLEVKEYELKIKKRDKLQIFFREYSIKLNKFYSSKLFLKSKNKMELKQKKYRELYSLMYRKRLANKQKLNHLVYKIQLSQNAFFSDYIVYFSNKDSLKQVLWSNHNGNFMKMIKAIKNY